MKAIMQTLCKLQFDEPKDARAAAMNDDPEKNEKKQKRRGSVLVYEQLREDILWMKIEPGTAIDEVELANRFGVSRTPIREALLLLQGDWLVQFLPNRTSIVAPLSLNNMRQYFDSHLMLARLAARSAAMTGNVDQDALRVHVRAFRAAIAAGDHPAALRSSLALTRQLTALTGNIFLNRYFGHSLDSGIRTSIRYFFPNASPDELIAAADLADHLIDAVAAGEIDASDAAMKAIVMHEVDVILRALTPVTGDKMDITMIEGLE